MASLHSRGGKRAACFLLVQLLGSYPCADGRSKSANPPTSNLLPFFYAQAMSQRLIFI